MIDLEAVVGSRHVVTDCFHDRLGAVLQFNFSEVVYCLG